MAIDELIALVPPPTALIEKGGRKKWAQVQKDLGLKLPTDFYDFGMAYGSGCFQDGEKYAIDNSISIYVYNPFSPYYVEKWVKSYCNKITRYIKGIGLKNTGDIFDLYPMYPAKPGLLPWGRDDCSGHFFWLTEGEPENWPIIITVRHPDYNRFEMSLTTFLAKSFTRAITCIAWEDPITFSNPVIFRTVDIGPAG